VWTALASGAEPRPLGPGEQPLVSRDGATVAAGLFGAGPAKGPALALYPTSGARPSTFGDLARQNAVPLAWSPDSRYLAVMLVSTAVKGFAKRSGLAILDTTTGSLRTIASGIVYGASFAPDGSDRVVFGRASSQSLSARVNLYVAEAGGAGLQRITSDGRSLNPVWGPTFIAYDRERLRRNDAPVYQIWLRRPGGGSPRRLTSIRVRSLVSGLTPLGFSQNGSRLLAEFVGQDTSEAWTVAVPSGRARPVRVRRRPVVGGAISRDGSRLLVFEGGIEGPASADNVVTVPFAGGAPTLLVAHAAQPSWNE
jgi:Tol biopolymer transport system component